MCNFAVDIADIEKRWEIRFRDYFARDLELLATYRDEGLVDLEDDEIRATPVGELFVRNLALSFDRYLREKHAEDRTPVFSRTV
jgi:oxygen-independent coproporphyrinogen-3 oxidase